MIRHVVLIRFRDTVTPSAIDAIDDGLRALPARIAAIRSYSCGRDLRIADGSWDYGVVADFDDVDGWRTYDTDGEHDRVRRQLMAPFIAERASMRFQL